MNPDSPSNIIQDVSSSKIKSEEEAHKKNKTSDMEGLEELSTHSSSKSYSIFDKFNQIIHRPKEKELVTFFRELAILVEARVPLVRALNSIKNQKYSLGIIQMVTFIQKKVEGGESLSDSMEEFPSYFSSLYINVTRAGEASGRLDKVLNYLADNRERRYELRRKIVGALVYPGVILFSFLGVFVFLMVFVMPTLSKTLTESGTKLPWTTEVVLGISKFVTGHWIVLIIATVSLTVGIYYYVNTEEGKKQWDVIKINVPIFGTLLRNMYMNRFADNLGLLMRESVPITKSLEITAGIMDNHVYRNVLLDCMKEVQKGKMISGALDRSAYFPSVVSQILRVGEESGKTSETLEKIADYYTKEVDNMTQNMMALIEPILILLLGVGTAIIVASVIMPIYNMAGSL
ncbi:MAG: type II secretion system F family protein [Candidatus Moraniibacteriota bacterium]